MESWYPTLTVRNATLIAAIFPPPKKDMPVVPDYPYTCIPKSTDPDRGIRFPIRHVWKPNAPIGKKPLFVIGLHASTAYEKAPDRTITRARAIAEKNGFTGFVMFNLCPLRAENISELREITDQKLLKLVEPNIEAIQKELDRITNPVFWAGWGNNIKKRACFIECLKKIARLLAPKNPIWKRFGTFTEKWHPRHPARVRYNFEFEEFDIEEYIETLR